MNVWRKDFPGITPDLTYFDNAATAYKPQAVIDDMMAVYAHGVAPSHRSIYAAAEAVTARIEAVRQQVADFIGARYPEEIVFTAGATAGINMIAQSWLLPRFSSNQTVVISEIEHHANLLPWLSLAQKKSAAVTWIRVQQSGLLVPEPLENMVPSHTAIVALTADSNVLGDSELLAPDFEGTFLKQVAARAHDVGARLLIDASQAVAHRPINVQEWDADFVVFSGHKLYGPWGVGVAYIKKELHDQLVPYQWGGSMVAGYDLESIAWRTMPAMLESGTLPAAEISGLGAAISYLQKNVDPAVVMRHETALAVQCAQELAQYAGIRILNPREALQRAGHLVSFTVEGVHPHDVAAFAAQHGIAVRAGNQCAHLLHKRLGVAASVRASFALYNTTEEVERFTRVLGSWISY